MLSFPTRIKKKQLETLISSHDKIFLPCNERRKTVGKIGRNASSIQRYRTLQSLRAWSLDGNSWQIKKIDMTEPTAERDSTPSTSNWGCREIVFVRKMMFLQIRKSLNDRAPPPHHLKQLTVTPPFSARTERFNYYRRWSQRALTPPVPSLPNLLPFPNPRRTNVPPKNQHPPKPWS